MFYKIFVYFTMEAYLGSLPGHGVENVRRPLMNTMNLADLLPTSTIWTGLNVAPCPMYPPGAPALMPYVVEVDKLGQTIAVSPVDRAKGVDQRVIHAAMASFIQSARMVTPDVALQRKPYLACMPCSRPTIRPRQR